MISTDQFEPVLEILRAGFPRWFEGMPPKTLVAWCALLSDVNPERLKVAAVQFAQTSKWPPTVAELVELANGKSSLTAPLAWERVLDGQSELTESEERAANLCGGVEEICDVVARKSYGPPASPKRYTAHDEIARYRMFCECYSAIERDLGCAESEVKAKQLVHALNAANQPRLAP